MNTYDLYVYLGLAMTAFAGFMILYVIPRTKEVKKPSKKLVKESVKKS